MGNDLLVAALEYAYYGWSVAPAWTVRDGVCGCGNVTCGSPGKHPRIGWKRYQQQVPTEQEIREWWRLSPESNVLVITGRVSGIVVVDIDPRKGGDDAAHALRALGHLPDTRTALTGGGGEHLYYKHPGHDIPNAAGLAPGIDFRGDGGYVVAPPSVHASGRLYMWDVGSPTEIHALPKEIAELVASRHRVGVDGAQRAAFDAESMLTEPIREGERNDRLARIAGYYVSQQMPLDAVVFTLLGVNASLCAPPLGSDEVRKIADSIWRAEQRNRQAAIEVSHRLNGGSDASAPIPPTDRLLMAQKLWGELQVDNVSDWYIVRGDSTEYVLVANDDEVRLGDDLLNYAQVRRALLNNIAVTLKPVDVKATWPRYALLLRQVAREEYAEPVIADHRVRDWVNAMTDAKGVQVDPESRERAGYLRTRAIVVEGKIHVKPSVLHRYLDMDVGEKMTLSQLRRTLKRAGWEEDHVRIRRDDGAESTSRTWSQVWWNEG